MHIKAYFIVVFVQYKNMILLIKTISILFAQNIINSTSIEQKRININIDT